MTAATTDRARVLIVEDEALIAEEIRERLTRLNYNVVGVEDSGERAIREVARTQPDLVLMDIRLKGRMDGIQAADAIRRSADVPIVYLTAHSDKSTLERAKQTLPYGYILKPLQERDIAVSVEVAVHRHKLERELRQSEVRYATTLASIGDGVITADTRGRVMFMNPVAEVLTGWPQSEAVRAQVETVLSLVKEEGGEAIPNPALQALETRTTVRLGEAALLVRRDGEKIPIDDSASPIVDERGEITGTVVAFRDIRDRRAAEEKLRQAEDQLRQAQKMEAIGRLTGGMAHDFNNLLMVIIGASDLILGKDPLDESLRQLVSEIRSAGQRSAALTRQLLAFSRRQILAPRVLNLDRHVSDITPLLRRVIGEDLILSCRLNSSDGHVLADPSQIEQIIMNLVINSRDALPRGGEITLETGLLETTDEMAEITPAVPPGRYVFLSVTDNGVGMTKETKSHLFEPFFTTKEKGIGTGLGLATVWGIVRQSGGYISVRSELGHGTTFRIYFPAALTNQEIPAESVTTPIRGIETLLLVEDEETVSSFVAQALRSHGYRVISARNGNEALEILHRVAEPIHLLVTDVVMPGMSGRELAEQVTSFMPNVPVLFLSGYTEDTVVHHGVASGETAFLQKPFTIPKLTQKIREVLDHPVRQKEPAGDES